MTFGWLSSLSSRISFARRPDCDASTMRARLRHLTANSSPSALKASAIVDFASGFSLQYADVSIGRLIHFSALHLSSGARERSGACRLRSKRSFVTLRVFLLGW